MNEQQTFPKRNGIDKNTYVSVGLLITIICGFTFVIGAIYSAKFDLATNQLTLSTKVDANQAALSAQVLALTTRVDKFEKLQETWGFQDQFKWSVHLQRDNEKLGLKVPEPEPSK